MGQFPLFLFLLSHYHRKKYIFFAYSHLCRALSYLVDPVQMVLISLIHFFSHDMLTIVPPRKRNNGSVILFVHYKMKCQDYFPYYVITNILKHFTQP